MRIMVQLFASPHVHAGVDCLHTNVLPPCLQDPLWVLGAEGSRDLCLLSCLLDPGSSLFSQAPLTRLATTLASLSGMLSVLA